MTERQRRGVDSIQAFLDALRQRAWPANRYIKAMAQQTDLRHMTRTPVMINIFLEAAVKMSHFGVHASLWAHPWRISNKFFLMKFSSVASLTPHVLPYTYIYTHVCAVELKICPKFVLSWAENLSKFSFFYFLFFFFFLQGECDFDKKRKKKKKQNTFCWAENLSNYVAQQ